MRSFIAIFFVFLPGFALAQHKPDSNLQEMVNAEKAFIKMAKDQNRRDAFLYYLSDSAITAGPNGPQKGKASIQKQTVNSAWLFWEVAYSDIASSGDFGYNTGPWEYREHKTDEKPVAFGEFNSIWKKQSDGTWKNVLDIGIRHDAPLAKVKWSTSTKPLKTQKAGPSEDKGREELIAVEKKFITTLATDRKAAYKSNLSREARIMYSGFLPYVSAVQKQKFVNEIPSPANIQFMDGEVAASNDLGYVYGSADITILKDGKNINRKASYVRFWKKEDGKNWKIVVDVWSF